jgi:flagellar motor switch protein FliM
MLSSSRPIRPCDIAQSPQRRVMRSDGLALNRPLRRARTTFAAFEASMKNQKDG